jgi:hypothetical protein
MESLGVEERAMACEGRARGPVLELEGRGSGLFTNHGARHG